ncbi:hypothetical protein FNJ87_18525 [Nonlabens mediterrranea]|uniref:Uncharacterized protein n=1 Tax=Nonlabens mediterrranea TaxID=1419947 RepID=A0ABS0A9Z5_9FLAO|nr:hypothetical protein [Nonlabens mediterrranea]MBF4986222.1 hypothetical protein [Nonlabens mediterrranea]
MKNQGKSEKDNLPYNPDVTDQDLQALRNDNAHLHSDNQDDQQLKNREEKVDFTGKDLDIPGRTEAQKNNGPNGLNDEENKLHSQGGDRQNHLERNDAAR